MAPSVEEICKDFGTTSIPSITITITADLVFIHFLLLLYKFSQGNSEIEWYTGSVVRKIQVGLG